MKNTSEIVKNRWLEKFSCSDILGFCLPIVVFHSDVYRINPVSIFLYIDRVKLYYFLFIYGLMLWLSSISSGVFIAKLTGLLCSEESRPILDRAPKTSGGEQAAHGRIEIDGKGASSYKEAHKSPDESSRRTAHAGNVSGPNSLDAKQVQILFHKLLTLRKQMAKAQRISN